MAGFAAEGLEVGDGGAVGGEDAQAFAGGHAAQDAVGAQDGERAVEAFDVEDGVAHGGSLRAIGGGGQGGEGAGRVFFL